MSVRTLLCSRYYPPPWGAGAVRAKFFAEAFRKAGWEVDILIPIQPNRNESTTMGVNGERVLARHFYTVPRTLFLDFPSTLIGSLALARSVHEHSPYDLCIAMSPPPDVVFLGYWLKRLGLVQHTLVDIRDDVASMIRTLYSYDRGISDFRVTLSKAAVRKYHSLLANYDTIIAVTEGLASHTSRLIEREVSVVYNGAPVSHFQNPMDSRESSLPLRKAILVADLDAPYHCVETIIQSLEQSLDLDDWSPRLTIVGDGRFKRGYMKRAKDCGISHCIQFLGSVHFKDLPEVLWMHDFGIVGRPTDLNWRLSIPTKTFEYIAAGLPVFAFGPPDSEVERFIERHEVGMYVPSTCPDEIAPRLGAFAKTRFEKRKLRSASQSYDREEWCNRMVGLARDTVFGGT